MKNLPDNHSKPNIKEAARLLVEPLYVEHEKEKKQAIIRFSTQARA